MIQNKKQNKLKGLKVAKTGTMVAGGEKMEMLESCAVHQDLG